MFIKRTILVAADDELVRDMLATELEVGWDVLKARDGLDAICLYERHVEHVVAIVTDLNMPRLDGRLVTEWVHHIRPQLPVIIMSGHVTNQDLEDLLQSPSVNFLAKPFEPVQLETLLNDALGKRVAELA